MPWGMGFVRYVYAHLLYVYMFYAHIKRWLFLNIGILDHFFSFIELFLYWPYVEFTNIEFYVLLVGKGKEVT